eukprot:CAMPEP_0168357808 /NCGR_PEP_ID=MMETSP0228-20121227/784_1 /TAXON_ID=133427 /ORGANISM="Protoceratium reticulatum, Strain CCCM 535 (=CCMP 1889)" /LENGTH=594 /DNA_ID=CAMNT_0008370351 /DNA_START=127 /DNA_END=1909 /DNA_ORIENTATION=-
MKWLLLMFVIQSAPGKALLTRSGVNKAVLVNVQTGTSVPRAGGKYFSGPIDVYYTAEMLDKLQVYLENTHSSTEQRFKAELGRLMAAAERTQRGSSDHNALDAALQFSRQDRQESEAATLELLEFYYTARAMMGSHSTAPDCRFLACGPDAECVSRNGRARCECRACFAGDGFTCRPRPCDAATDFTAKPLLGRVPAGYPLVPRSEPGAAVELHLALLSPQHLAVAVRDASAGDAGRLIVGRVVGAGVTWGAWQGFADKAFGPALAGLPGGRLLAAYRDSDQGGVLRAQAARLNATDGLSLVLGGPRPLARSQAQRAALVPLAASRVVCLFAESASAGAAVLRVRPDGALSVEAATGFAEGLRVAQLAAAPLSPTSLVVGYRALPDPLATSRQASRELSAVWMGLQDNELVIDPHPIAIEPGLVGMLARDVAVVAENMFAYSYESGRERLTKLVIVRVDPVTHKMSVVGGPRVIGRGETTYVQGISMASGPLTPTTFTYFQHPRDNGMAEVCHVSPRGEVARCSDVMWSDSELKVVSGSRLPDGRLAFASANMDGALFYQLLGTQEMGMAALPWASPVPRRVAPGQFCAGELEA